MGQESRESLVESEDLLWSLHVGQESRESLVRAPCEESKTYGVATISRLLKITHLFCRMLSLL